MALKCWGSARFLNDVPSITTPLGSHLLDEVLVHRKVTRAVCQEAAYAKRRWRQRKRHFKSEFVLLYNSSLYREMHVNFSPVLGNVAFDVAWVP